MIATAKELVLLVKPGHDLRVPRVVLGAVSAAAVGVVLTLLVICCCWCCCCRKNRKGKKGDQKIHVENPTERKGNENRGQAQQQQYQKNPERIPEQQQHQKNPTPSFESISRSSSHRSQSGNRSLTPLPYSSYMSNSTDHSMSSTNNGSSGPPRSTGLSLGSSQTMFSYEELKIATNGFSKGNILGQGGFGLVHKGVLPTGKEIAVKSLKDGSGQGEREFQAEVEIISRVHHRHLVSLVGYCMSGLERLLVYELVPNKTLEFHLHGKGRPAMDWPTRIKIALGAARGLAYLHEDCHPKIIHRDIKAANILIDGNFEAKVADFGLAKFGSLNDTHVSTRVMGTLGYLAPEYAQSGKLTSKSDVFSFGVMLLELITARRPFERNQNVSIVLSEWARPLLTTAIESENFDNLVDPRIQDQYNHSEMSRMVHCAANCIRKSARHRPKMSQVVRALEGNMSITDLGMGVTPGRSIVNRYDGNTSEYSDSQYNGTSNGFVSNEVGGTTNEYNAMYTHTSSSDGHTTRELDSEEVSIRRPQQRFF